MGGRLSPPKFKIGDLTIHPNKLYVFKIISITDYSYEFIEWDVRRRNTMQPALSTFQQFEMDSRFSKLAAAYYNIPPLPREFL